MNRLHILKIQNNITLVLQKKKNIFFFCFGTYLIGRFIIPNYVLISGEKNNGYIEKGGGGGGTNRYIPKHTKLGRVKR